MLRRFLYRLATAAAVTLALAPAALGSGGDYVFDGGTPAEQGQVGAALDASSFNWSIVPGPVVVHIRPGVDSRALPNEIWLDADLLDAGPFAWGVVQHEYGHEVDYAVLTGAMREQLFALLGGSSWWGAGGEGHAELASERFADLVSWAYWPSPDNVMKPSGPQDEGGHVKPAAFRAALAAILPAAQGQARAPALRVTAALGRHARKP